MTNENRTWDSCGLTGNRITTIREKGETILGVTEEHKAEFIGLQFRKTWKLTWAKKKSNETISEFSQRECRLL